MKKPKNKKCKKKPKLKKKPKKTLPEILINTPTVSIEDPILI